MTAENPLPARTIEFLALRAMPAGLDVHREGFVATAIDRDIDPDPDHQPPMRRSIAMGVVWLALLAGCAWSLREGWIAAAFICIALAALFFQLWWYSDADSIGRELRLDMTEDLATLTLGGPRRKHRRVWRVPIGAVRLVLCPVKGFVLTNRGHELPSFTGVGVFAIVPGGDDGQNPAEPGWIMLAGGHDYRPLLADLERDLPELPPPEQFWEPIRGKLDRVLI
ncbi:MAG: hypothetical protein ACIAS6_06230 [Phycisphaerales bacterium JB060]